MFTRFLRTAAASLVAAVAAVAAAPPPTAAQDVTLASGTQIFVTPYLWLSGIDSTIKTPLPRAPEVPTSAPSICCRI